MAPKKGCITWNKGIKRTGIKTHGMFGTKLYKCWININWRTKYGKHWKHIDVCDEWKKFEPFRDWALKNGWEDGLTVERKDNYKGYNPDNCRFATWVEQAHNRKNTKLDWDKVIKIREMVKENIDNKIIISKFGIARQTLCDIRFNRTWVI